MSMFFMHVRLKLASLAGFCLQLFAKPALSVVVMLLCFFLLTTAVATAAPPATFAVENKCPPTFAVVSKMPSCVCGDACKCAPGDCPGKCPVKSTSYYDACVGIQTKKGLASGTAIQGAPTGKTWVTTCKHVTDAGATNVYDPRDGKLYPCKVIGADAGADLSIVEIDVALPTVPVSADPGTGAVFTLKGFGYRTKFSDVRKGQLASSDGAYAFIAASDNDSGAGYLSSAGTLLGMVSASMNREGSGFVRGPNARQIRELVAKLQGKPRADAGAPADGLLVSTQIMTVPPVEYGAEEQQQILKDDGTTETVTVVQPKYVLMAGQCSNGSCSIAPNSSFGAAFSASLCGTPAGVGASGPYTAAPVGDGVASGSCGAGSGAGRRGIWFPGKRLLGGLFGCWCH